MCSEHSEYSWGLVLIADAALEWAGTLDNKGA